jgi:hypothetical protein
VYSTYLGGSEGELGTDVAIDAEGHAFVTGTTFSTDFPIRNAAQPTHGGGPGSVYPSFNNDAFVTKLSPDGSGLEYSTFLGGSGDELGFALAIDDAGVANVVGQVRYGELHEPWPETAPFDFPTVNAVQPSFGGYYDAFVALVAPSGSTFLASTYLGGRFYDFALGVAVDASGMLVVTGLTGSTDFPMVAPFDDSLGEHSYPDAFVTRLAPGGQSFVYSSFLGGDGDDRYSEDLAYAVARAPSGGSTIVVGSTNSPDFPCVAPLQAAPGEGGDGFVTVIADESVPPEVSDVRATPAGEPFKLTITGANFRPGMQVFIGDDADVWERTKVKSAERVVLGGGRALRARFPKGQAVPIRLVTPNGLEASYSFTR